jgi:signal transduction histidine kinase
MAAGKTVRFEVQDHGIGIPEDFRARIFEKFAQAEATAGRRFAGTTFYIELPRARGCTYTEAAPYRG